MNEEYLWDKTGEPDPEIQQLEEILGTLRYQPRPLELPDELVVRRRRSYLPLLAIAAMIVMTLLAGGLWLRVKHTQTLPSQQANNNSHPAQVEPAPMVVQDNGSPKPATPEAPKVGPDKQQRNLVARNERHRNRHSVPALTPREREEALAAKEQLMVALRLASEKWNLAQRKTQSPAQPNQIRNQHKVG